MKHEQTNSSKAIIVSRKAILRAKQTKQEHKGHQRYPLHTHWFQILSHIRKTQHPHNTTQPYNITTPHKSTQCNTHFTTTTCNMQHATRNVQHARNNNTQVCFPLPLPSFSPPNPTKAKRKLNRLLLNNWRFFVFVFVVFFGHLLPQYLVNVSFVRWGNGTA
jgi:hypothetical protein